MRKLTKAEKLKRSREIRRKLGLYQLFQEHHIQVANVDWDVIAVENLLDAYELLGQLVDLELAVKEGK